jgi:hypothetical protein
MTPAAQGGPLSGVTELDELHSLVGGVQRCAASLRSRYGDVPVMLRICNDADRLVNDVDRLEIDADELVIERATPEHPHVGAKIPIPDTDYGADFWQGVDDEGVGGQVGSG